MGKKKISFQAAFSWKLNETQNQLFGNSSVNMFHNSYAVACREKQM